MKFTSTQKQAIFLWLILPPVITIVRFYLSLTDNSRFGAMFEIAWPILLKQALYTYAIFGVIVFVMFFIFKEKSTKVISESENSDVLERKEEDEKV